jgi:2'-5' RNA ligase
VGLTFPWEGAGIVQSGEIIMKAAFALLADHQTYNLVRKLSWDIHRKYRTGIDICRLPPHVSLKQPFSISDLDEVEKYMTELAAGISPFEVHLTGLELIPADMDGLQSGILWMNVQETDVLRGLHERINRELASRFEDVSAPFDSLEYHFHMTVVMGGQSLELYRKIYDEFSGRLKDLRYTVREIGLFVYDDVNEKNIAYINYKNLPLNHQRKKPDESS